MIQLTQAQYDAFKDSELKLQALEETGVDNWEWYDVAMDLYQTYKVHENASFRPS